MLMLEDFIAEQEKYVQSLKDSEMSNNTIRKYSLALRKFIDFAIKNNHCAGICKNSFIEYKQVLQERHKPSTLNLYIIALNRYLKYLAQQELCIKTVKLQSRNSLENCITIEEYNTMLQVAKSQKKNDIYYIMRTIASTGIRVSELASITVEAIAKETCVIHNKSKIRYIVIAKEICKELQNYCKSKGIIDGYLFYARNPDVVISEVTVLRRLKRIAFLAGVDEEKAFPHNLRHLFAKRYMVVHNNLDELSDILGHTKLETTRIYTRTSNAEKRMKIGNLGL